MPREQYFRRQRTLHKITCRFQYYHPRRHYSLGFILRQKNRSFTGVKQHSPNYPPKGQVTKCKTEYSNTPTNGSPPLLVQTIEEDAAYKNTQNPKQKIFELNEAETRVQTEIQQLKEAKQQSA